MQTIETKYERSIFPYHPTEDGGYTNLPIIKGFNGDIGPHFIDQLINSGVLAAPTYFVYDNKRATMRIFTDEGSTIDYSLSKIFIDPGNRLFFVTSPTKRATLPVDTSYMHSYTNTEFGFKTGIRAFSHHNGNVFSDIFLGLDQLPKTIIHDFFTGILDSRGVQNIKYTYVDVDNAPKIGTNFALPTPQKFIELNKSGFKLFEQKTVNCLDFNNCQGQGLRPVSRISFDLFEHDTSDQDHATADSLSSITELKKKTSTFRAYSELEHDTFIFEKFDEYFIGSLVLTYAGYRSEVSQKASTITNFDASVAIQNDLGEYSTSTFSIINLLGNPEMTKKQYKTHLRDLIIALRDELKEQFGATPQI